MKFFKKASLTHINRVRRKEELVDMFLTIQGGHCFSDIYFIIRGIGKVRLDSIRLKDDDDTPIPNDIFMLEGVYGEKLNEKHPRDNIIWVYPENVVGIVATPKKKD